MEINSGKRMCIYVCYSKKGNLCTYHSIVLKSLRKLCSFLVFISNCCISNEDMDKVSLLSDLTILRDNFGYDSGAFRDAIIDYIGWHELSKYDELILANDSFLGPVFSLEKVFNHMEIEICDFWGLTGQAAGEYINPIRPFKDYVSSYFMVFRHNVLESKAFKDFWEDYEYPETFRQAIEFYELGINECLSENGFLGKTYVPIDAYQLNRNEVIYYFHSYEMYRDYQFPIFKKKCVLMRNKGFENVLESFRYIKNYSDYPIELLEEVLDSQFEINGKNALIPFYERHRQIYIYGNGVAGKNLVSYFEYKNWKYEAVIVTQKKHSDPACVLEIQEVNFDEETGVIVSVVHDEVSEEICRTLDKYCYDEHIFRIVDCKAIPGIK